MKKDELTRRFSWSRRDDNRFFCTSLVNMLDSDKETGGRPRKLRVAIPSGGIRIREETQQWQKKTRFRFA
jgi:hypothetical protein